MNPKVDEYIENANNWQDEMQELRSILLECGLTEELKWGELSKRMPTCDGSHKYAN